MHTSLSLLFIGGITNASAGGNQHRNLHSHNRSRLPLASQDQAVSSVAVVHRTPSGETISTDPRRPHSLRSTTTGSIDIYRQESSGTALDSGVSGMDVSTLVTQDDINEDGFRSSSLPVYISVMVASTTPSDVSIVSSMSISEESNSDEDDNLSRSSPRPTLLYETDVEIPSNSGTPLKPLGVNLSAEVSDDLRLSPVRHHHHHHHNPDENYEESGDSKRLKFIEQRPMRIPGSPHPRRAAIPWRFLPNRSVVCRRRYTGDADVSSRQKPWRRRRQHPSSSETDMEASTPVEVESLDGRNAVQVEQFGSPRSGVEGGKSVGSALPHPTPPTEAASNHAVDVIHIPHVEVTVYLFNKMNLSLKSKV